MTAELSRPWARLRGDLGQVGGIEVLPFGLLIFVVASLLIANAWAVVDARARTDAAAHEAVRSVVEAPDPFTAERDGRAAAIAVIPQLADDAGSNVQIDTPDGFRRCAPAAVTVSLQVPRLRLPFLGGTGGTYEVRSTRRELIDPYRNGLPGASTC